MGKPSRNRLPDLCRPDERGTLGGNDVWLDNVRAEPRWAVFDANFSDKDRVELCMYLDDASSVLCRERYCCPEPEAIGAWDDPQEGSLRVPWQLRSRREAG